MTAPAVRLRGLERHYRTAAGTVRAVDGVDLEIAAGERVALTGPSGSGKSTLLGLIGALDRPTAGEIAVLGADLAALGDDARARFRRERVGFVFQSYDLLPFLTAAENVALQAGISGASSVSAAAALERLGLADRAHHMPDQLSGGQKQRVGVARALVHGPALILADEPTGGLDSTTSEAVMDAIVGAVAQLGATLIVVTHDARIAGHLDRVVRMRDGRAEGERALAAPEPARA